MTKVYIIGAGLAGSEAAWQLAQFGVHVILYEMRPMQMTPAHRTGYCAELVCSNSFRSADVSSAPGLLKAELAYAGSLIMKCARRNEVPAGKALAVDREAFARCVTEHLVQHPFIEIRREEIKTLPDDAPVIIATGPLTSQALADELKKYAGDQALHFYDAVAPLVEASSIDMSYAFWGSRYDNDDQEAYLNCPLDKETYTEFWKALTSAEKYPLHDFESLEECCFFEGCLPIEVMAERGFETLLYGPMKPVGLRDPRTGKEPFAVIQLRRDNVAGTLFNIVGFQTTLKRHEQERVLRIVPAFRNVEIVRYGMVHRNTFLCSPLLLNDAYQFARHSHLFLAGQISGVEGYIESTASGLMAAYGVLHHLAGVSWEPAPVSSATGALAHYVAHADPRHFQPMNINWGIIKTPPRKKMNKKIFREECARRALQVWAMWLEKVRQKLLPGFSHHRKPTHFISSVTEA